MSNDEAEAQETEMADAKEAGKTEAQQRKNKKTEWIRPAPRSLGLKSVTTV
jgi:hypothetical protein